MNMNREEMMCDRYYDSLYSKYEEEERIPISEYRELEGKYNELLYQMQDVIYYLRNNDIAGAYEYLKSEGLV